MLQQWAEKLLKKNVGKDKVTTGAGGGGSSDIGKVTQIAKDMVTKYGMSEELGPIAYVDNEEEVFLGKDQLLKTKACPEETVQKIDKEVKRIIFEGYQKPDNGRPLMNTSLQKLLNGLQTLTFDEISNILYKDTYPTEHSDKPDQNQGNLVKKESALKQLV